MTIYPFEVRCFEKTKLLTKFVGHPLAESIKNHAYKLDWKQALQIPEGSPIISLFPGSRSHEVVRNLPRLLAAAKLIHQKDKEAIFCLSYASESIKRQIETITANYNLKFFLVPKDFRYEQMRDSHSAIAKSGTITLELALHKTPTVVIYEVSKLNRFIAKHIIKLNLPFYGIVNILTQRETFPELIERAFDPELICHSLLTIHHPGQARQNTIEGCQLVIDMLQSENASRNAMLAIKEVLAW